MNEPDELRLHLDARNQTLHLRVDVFAASHSVDEVGSTDAIPCAQQSPGGDLGRSESSLEARVLFVSEALVELLLHGVDIGVALHDGFQ
ncbi:hypothetical protein [Scleromatobacter humisilvae]|uniref:Uncharacterized protein n=1 Tax=Scleromatobacter humisilvae TaxID=2897159 RepID=A0A9X1YRG7_9BURK|nr:hypothetical protein [Scleromatobacter humisilvae]MCK9687276.1 hypothetical protein [Scleromatobacter humisilvae]